VGIATVEHVRKRFVLEEVEVALNRRRPRWEYSRRFDGEQEARMVAVTCGPPPEGSGQGGLLMFPLVEFPELVQHYAPSFASAFTEKAFVQFQRYVSGLIVSENKTVDSINRLFVLESRNQSSLNRLLTESPFSLKALNQARLALLASLPGTQMKRKGVLSVDDTHLTHYGRHFDQIAYLYDPAQKRHMRAHNLVNLHYSDDLTDYPVAFELWKPADLEELENGLPTAGVKLTALAAVCY
jgi:hypothetical protein